MSNNELVNILGPTGETLSTITREEAEQNNHTTENVLIFAFTPDGHIWVQRRSNDKKFHAGKLDITACGGVTSGERHRRTAARELREETGLEIPALHYVETFLNVFEGDN